MSQEEMVEAMGDGDMEAFHLLYQDTARPVHSLILSLARNPEEAEDVMQDTYLTVQTKAGSYVPQDRPLIWVFTIVRDPYYMRFGEQKMRADVTLEDLAENGEREHCAPLGQAADCKVLLDALGRISHEGRQTILPHAAAGMKHREVAEALQMPLVAVLSEYNRSAKEPQEPFRCPR